MMTVQLASIAVSTEADPETLQSASVEVDEIISAFTKTYAQMAELHRALERTCRRAEQAFVFARAVRRLRL
jgi:hypothetical protein